ncbi:MAG: hypothetical protein LBK52_04875 [Deltaproteobacteria bacterium]|jgi:hypothetical protein|nr:hypothetical protein [Deltaproteobacteria bacterium]
MELDKNPFYLLKAAPQDSPAGLAGRIEAMAMSLNVKVLERIRTGLFNSRQRLAAEMAWLPGAAPEEQIHLVGLLKSNPQSLLEIESLAPLARSNLLAAAASKSRDHFLDYALLLFQAFEKADPEEILKTVSQAREASGFPAVALEEILEELQSRRRFFAAAVYGQMKKMPPVPRLELAAALAEAATDSGRLQAPLLAADVLNLYEEDIKHRMDSSAQKVHDEILRLHGRFDALSLAGPQSGADTFPEIDLEPLREDVQSWDKLAQPFQLLAKSQGLNHPESRLMAVKLRELAFLAYNTGGHLDLAQDITLLIREVFAEVVDAAEQAEKDNEILEKLAEEKGLPARDQPGQEMQNRIRAVFSLVRDIQKGPAGPLPASEVRKIESLEAALKSMPEAAKNDPSFQKVALRIRTAALSLHNRSGQSGLAVKLLLALKDFFGRLEPFAALLASDLSTISRRLPAEAGRKNFFSRPWAWLIAGAAVLLLAALFFIF